MEYKAGDKVLIIKSYPGVSPTVYDVGEVVTLKSVKHTINETNYWEVEEDKDCGIFEDRFVYDSKLTRVLR